MSEAGSASALARRVVQDGIDSLRRRLIADAPAVPLMPSRSDYDLNPELRPAGSRMLAPAAVLLPIVECEEPTVLFTRRTEHLSSHAGQVSFPGGRAQDGDGSLVDTALRETHEEIGLTADYVTIAGFLEPYETGTGYAILPVVGLLRTGFTLVPQISEVAEIFEVPLGFLLDPANRQRDSREWQGRRREFYVFRYKDHYIWGATAAILVNFGDRLAR